MVDTQPRPPLSISQCTKLPATTATFLTVVFLLPFLGALFLLLPRPAVLSLFEHFTSTTTEQVFTMRNCGVVTGVVVTLLFVYRHEEFRVRMERKLRRDVKTSSKQTGEERVGIRRAKDVVHEGLAISGIGNKGQMGAGVFWVTAGGGGLW
jgi:hypothetical protein